MLIDNGWLIPAAHDTWLTAARSTIRRCRIQRPDEGMVAR